jgi:diacylglycerol kinase
MLEFIKNRLPAFKHAFSGLFYVLRTQKNSWVHATATVLAILLAALLRLQSLQFALLLVVIGIVWAAEIINTSIEAIVDMVSPDHNRLAKIAKDASAAAVLVTALLSIAVGIILLGPPLLVWIKHLFQS